MCRVKSSPHLHRVKSLSHLVVLNPLSAAAAVRSAVKTNDPVLVVQIKHMGVPSMDKYDNICDEIEERVTRPIGAEVVWIYACERHDGTKYVKGSYNGTYRVGIAVPVSKQRALSLDVVFQITDGSVTIADGSENGTQAEVKKTASRAAGEYVIMGDSFCAGGCGNYVGHREDCRFGPKKPKARAAWIQLPAEIEGKVQLYTTQVIVAHKEELQAKTPLTKGDKVPMRVACKDYKKQGKAPGETCGSTRCRLFPCVAVRAGTDKEMVVRRLFDADPDVQAWREAAAP